MAEELRKNGIILKEDLRNDGDLLKDGVKTKDFSSSNSYSVSNSSGASSIEGGVVRKEGEHLQGNPNPLESAIFLCFKIFFSLTFFFKNLGSIL